MIHALNLKVPVIPYVRRAVVDDIPLLTDLMQTSVRRLASQHYSQQQVESALRYIFEIDRQLIDDGTYFVAEVDGEIAGSGGWSCCPGGHAAHSFRYRYEQAHLTVDEDTAQLRSFFVHPHFARRGIGRRLLQYSENTARRAGFTRLELIATLTGELLYIKSGFTPVETLHVVLPDGVSVPAIRMEKLLS